MAVPPSSPEVDAELCGVGVIQNEGSESLNQVDLADEEISKHLASRYSRKHPFGAFRLEISTPMRE